MTFLRGLISDEPGSPSMTRFSLAVVLSLVVLVIGRWLITGQDVPHGVGSLLEITLATSAGAKVVQKFAEGKNSP
jgi:DNA mismatch repair protein MutH